MMCMLQLNALFRSCEFLFVSAWVKSTWVHDFRLFTSLQLDFYLGFDEFHAS
ncbi:hypothetical protein KC19_1G323900 [Ceratodon purpureus]|uniref:Uncharacterized protein n=1 Tax=Ceratodon purpureus TaxID=3225 RepID=A0A8T0JD24_CERPU|nr:hypothetical protein KC19_1G323900 [Ceratodon purpureus]